MERPAGTDIAGKRARFQGVVRIQFPTPSVVRTQFCPLHFPMGTAVEAAAEQLRSLVRAGRLDGESMDAVLAAAGHRVRRRRAWPAGLSTREVEVLRLAALGRSNRDIARTLVISERTAAHHIQHIYNKIGVSTRGAAALFAVQHDLLHGALEAQE